MIRKQFFLRLLTCLLLAGIATTLTAQRTRFVYGVNGHPLTQEAYKQNLDIQVRLLNQLNCRYYRVDVAIEPSGEVVNAPAFVAMLNLMQKNGIRVVPVLVFSAAASADRPAEQAYTEGLAYGKTFAHRYKTYFDYYEVGNEMDNSTIVGQVHGNLPEHFDTPAMRVIAPYTKGVCEGIRAEDKTAKRIINFTWVHYGFLKKLMATGVPFEMVAPHWYADMGDLQKANAGFGNVIETVYREFKKPIWVTEINVRGGVPVGADSTKEGWLYRNLAFLRKNRYVGAVFIYELLDQPAFAEARAGAAQNASEAAYGLGAWQTNGQGRYKAVKEKPLFNQYRAFIRRNP